MTTEAKSDNGARQAPQAGLWILAVALPLYFIPLAGWSIERTRSTLFLVLTAGTLAVVAATWLTRRALRQVQLSFGARVVRFLHTQPLAIPALVYGLVQILAAVFSLSPATSWFHPGNGHGTLLAIAGAVLLLLTLAALRGPADEEHLVTALLLGSVPVSIYGLLQYFGLDPIAWSTAATSPVGSTLGVPGVCGAYLAAVMYFTLARLVQVESTGRGPRGGLGFLFALQLVCLVLTLDRGALVGGLAGAIVYAWLAGRNLPRARRVGVLLAVAAAGGIAILFVSQWGTLLLPQPAVTLAGLSAIRETSMSVRIAMWQSLPPLILARPLLGYGPNTFRSIYGPEQAFRFNPLGEPVPTDPYNVFLNHLLSAGLAGLLALLWLLSVFYRSVFTRASEGNDRARSALYAACAASITAILVQWQFHPEAVVLSALFWLVLGLGGRRPSEAAPKRDGPE